MTAAMIPYETHAMIRDVVAAYMEPVRAAYAKLSVGARLKGHVSKLPANVSNSPSIWYFKDTKADLAFSRETGYIILDHVRRARTPGGPNLETALKARATTLKEIEAYEDTRRQEADAAAQAAGVQEAQV